jgi:SAM-dependent methyltransferase
MAGIAGNPDTDGMAGTRTRRDDRRLAVHQEVDTGLAEVVPDLSRPDSWTLFIDGTAQSHVDLADPTYLEFEYVRRLAHILDLGFARGEPLRVLHLGGGGLTLPRYVAATRPGSVQQVAEADAALVELVRRRLPLPRAGGPRGGRVRGRISIRVGDAREILETVRAGSFDIVIGDVFAGAHTPADLTTVECVAAAARALRPDGIYALNVTDGAPLAHAKAQVSALLAIFRNSCMIAEPAVLRGRRFGNLVLAGSRRVLPEAGLRRAAAADPFPARLVCGADLVKFAAGARPLADATARPSPAAPEDAFAGLGSRRRQSLTRSG